MSITKNNNFIVKINISFKYKLKLPKSLTFNLLIETKLLIILKVLYLILLPVCVNNLCNLLTSRYFKQI